MTMKWEKAKQPSTNERTNKAQLTNKKKQKQSILCDLFGNFRKYSELA